MSLWTNTWKIGLLGWVDSEDNLRTFAFQPITRIFVEALFFHKKAAPLEMTWGNVPADFTLESLVIVNPADDVVAMTPIAFPIRLRPNDIYQLGR